MATGLETVGLAGAGAFDAMVGAGALADVGALASAGAAVACFFCGAVAAAVVGLLALVAGVVFLAEATGAVAGDDFFVEGGTAAGVGTFLPEDNAGFADDVLAVLVAPEAGVATFFAVAVAAGFFFSAAC